MIPAGQQNLNLRAGSQVERPHVDVEVANSSYSSSNDTPSNWSSSSTSNNSVGGSNISVLVRSEYPSTQGNQRVGGAAFASATAFPFPLDRPPQFARIVECVPHSCHPWMCTHVFRECLKSPNCQDGCFLRARNQLPINGNQRQFEVAVLADLGLLVAERFDLLRITVSYHEFRCMVLEVFAAMSMPVVSTNSPCQEFPPGPSAVDVATVLALLGDDKLPHIVTRNMRCCTVANNFPLALCEENHANAVIVLQCHYRAVMQRRGLLLPAEIISTAEGVLWLQRFRIHERIISRLPLLSEIVMMYIHDHHIDIFCCSELTLSRYSLLLIALDVDIFHSHWECTFYFQKPLNVLIVEVYARLDRVRVLLSWHLLDANADDLLLQLVFSQEQQWQLLRQQQQQFLVQQRQQQQQIPGRRLYRHDLLHQLQQQQQDVGGILQAFQGVIQGQGIDLEIDVDRLQRELGFMVMEDENVNELDFLELLAHLEELNRLHQQNLQGLGNSAE